MGSALLDGSPVAEASGAKGQCCHTPYVRSQSAVTLTDGDAPADDPAGASLAVRQQLEIS